MAISGLGSFAGGMARGIESGVGLVNQYEDISRRRRRRDAAGALQELGTFEDFSEQNTQAIPVQFQGAEADLTPGAQPLAPTGGALPDVMTAGGMKRPHFNEYVAAREKAFAPFYEDNPELMFQVRKELEETRRHMLMHAASKANSADDETASRILVEAYDRLLGDDGSEPAEIRVITTPGVDGKPGERLVKIGDHTMPFDNLGALLRNPEAYDAWLQGEKSRMQDAEQFDRTASQADRQIDILESTREDQARYNAGQLALGQAELDSLNSFRQAELEQAQAEHGTERAKVLGQRFDDIQSAQGDFLTNLEAQDPEFFKRFGRDIPTVASALAAADPSRSASQLLSTAEWLLRTRDPGAFQRAMERSPGMQDRWMVTAEDGSQVPAYRIEDGEVVITTGIGVDPRTGQEVEVIIDPVDGTPHIMTPALRRAFAAIENAGAAPAGPANAGGPAAAATPGAIPEPPPLAPGAAAPSRDELMTRREQDLANLDSEIAELEKKSAEQGYTSVIDTANLASLRRQRRQLQEAITRERTRQMQGKDIARPGER